MRYVVGLLVVVGAAALGPPATTQEPAVAAADGPNVVLIVLDDMRADELAAMPNTVGRIQDRGATFEAAYSPYPLCCPARATILTGQYAHNHKVLGNHRPLGGFEKLDDSSTIATWLDSRGYISGYVGKYLNEYGSRRSERYVPPGWTSWAASVDGVINYVDFTLNQNGRLVAYENKYQTTVAGEQSRAFIRRQSGAGPFVLVTAFLAPHVGTPVEADDPVFKTPAVARKYRNAYQGQQLPTDASYNEADVSDKPRAIRDLPPIPPRQMSAHQEVYQQRLESIRSVDDQVDQIVDTLAATGELSSTYIVVTSDNGYLLGEHRIRNGKTLGYEPSARVPLLMRGPGIPSGAVVEQLVGLHDLAPTVLQATGTYGAQTHPLDGRSLLPLVRDDDVAAKRDLVLEAGPRDTTTTRLQYQGVRTNTGWKYIEHDTGEKEMYDLDRDPYELENLAGDPAFATRRRVLDGRLDELKDCAGPECSKAG